MAAAGMEYTFVAIDAADESSVVLDIRPHDAATQKFITRVCDKMTQALKNYHDICERNHCPEWAKWKVVEWSQQQVQERQKFGAWAGDLLCGYLWIRAGFPSAVTQKQAIIYVEIMAATPTNIGTAVWSKRFGFVGRALLAFTVLQSIKQGFEGRFGLHAADDAAAKYYRHLNEDMGNGLFSAELIGIEGVPPRVEQAKSNPYFEAEPVGAVELLRDYANG